MQGSIAILGKNLQQVVPGTVAFFSQASKAYVTWKRIKDRQYQHAPESVRDQIEVFEPTYQKRGICQHQNMWVDRELSSEVCRKDVADLLKFKLDAYRMFHAGSVAAVFGGYSLPFYIWWLGNDTFIPSTFNSSAHDWTQWRAAQDLYRYKFAPLFLADTRIYLDLCMAPPAPNDRAWDDLWEKNDVRRDPKSAAEAAKLYDIILPMSSMRRRCARLMARSMGLPTFPLWAKLCIINRIRSYWELIWNEDYMVITTKEHQSMSDEELREFAWRRFLAPYDKNLTREEVLQRVEDYFQFMGDAFVKEGKAPNIHIVASYCLGYYNDPAYLEANIEELDNNDFDNIASWGKDAYLRRLEFENGPLRDQVEAHTQGLLIGRKAA